MPIYAVECATRDTAEPYTLLVQAPDEESALRSASRSHLASHAAPLVQPVSLCEEDRQLLTRTANAGEHLRAWATGEQWQPTLRKSIRVYGEKAVFWGIIAAVVLPFLLGVVLLIVGVILSGLPRPSWMG